MLIQVLKKKCLNTIFLMIKSWFVQHIGLPISSFYQKNVGYSKIINSIFVIKNETLFRCTYT